MVAFSLPANSRVGHGRTITATNQAAHSRQFNVYRWSPDDDENPRLDSFVIDTSQFGPMVLDALIYIKDHLDSTLTFRRSCREGICGSCSMNIDGLNTLACTKSVGDIKGEINIYPLPHMPVIKDLVPDIEYIQAQLTSIQPWLQSDQPTQSNAERLQSPQERARLDGLSECILCFCCSTSCPSYWWNSDRYLGPAVLLQAQRWLADSRDQATQQRLDQIEDSFRLYRCHQIMNCTQSCPKGLNPSKAIGEIKQALIKRQH